MDAADIFERWILRFAAAVLALMGVGALAGILGFVVYIWRAVLSYVG